MNPVQRRGRAMTFVASLLAALAALAATACAESRAPAAPQRTMTVQLQPLGSSTVSGRVTFTQADAGLEVRAEVEGLTPGKHGFHVHEFGDCAGDGSSAGPHYNPAGSPHGAPGSAASHLGDFGNLDADAQGRATMNFTIPGATLDQGPKGIVGRSVIVHANPDDLSSQPTGNAGPRIACGVILEPGSDATPVRPRT